MENAIFDTPQAITGLLAFILGGYLLGGVLGLFRYLLFFFMSRKEVKTT